ncbi:S41 family peptidase [Caulobacter sp. CCG-8]|uniref:S41 family peptidase n=1 Tax=Caulobacter sp. CCG-8 TaxID=3127958 RepID=UPI00307F7571
MDLTLNDPPATRRYQLSDLIAGADDSVRGALVGAHGLRQFLNTIDELDHAARVEIVEQAICLLEGFYAHLPLKRAMHAVDPIQRLKLLKRRLHMVESEVQFHHEMTTIFTSLRDLHTNYILPKYFADAVAFLPFKVKPCYHRGDRQYVVSDLVAGVSDPNFRPGVKLTHWNAIPIDRAVEIAASYHAGSNPAARHARGVDLLTTRAMNLWPPPDEEWVIVGYLDANNQAREVNVEWNVMKLPRRPESVAAAPAMAEFMGIDLEGDSRRRLTTLLYAPAAAKRRAAVAEAAGGDVASAASGLKSNLPEVFTAAAVSHGGQTFGYLRIQTFDVDDDACLVEAIRLLEHPLFPKTGVILDVRGNGGGLIWAGERLLQLFTSRRIEPTRAQLVATPLAVELCGADPILEAWKPSMARAFETGAIYSAAFPITDLARCNDIGQRYFGPAVLLTDARCYSTTDMFACGFLDHEIGQIIGLDATTGAGGANVWDHELVRQHCLTAGVATPLAQMDAGVGMRVAIRRTLRVGPEAGTEIEDLGAPSDIIHQPTLDDILHDDRDLLDRACLVLSGTSTAGLPVTITRNGASVTLDIVTTGIDRLEIFVDRRPNLSKDVTTASTQLTVPASVGSTLQIDGFANGQLAAVRLLTI